MSIAANARELARDAVNYTAVKLGRRHSEERLVADAGAVWNGGADDTWRNNSHFRDGSVFGDADWAEIGREHWALFNRLSRTANWTADRGDFGRVVEWGCGGGANAVTFAPHAGKEFVGVDIDPRTLAECERQVTAATDAPFRGVLADAANPEATALTMDECDLWTSFYVLELVPSPDYGLRLMKIAHDMLSPGGLAFVQIKYNTGSWRTRSRLRGYRSSTAAGMTTYGIDEFWSAMVGIGFTPEGLHLVPSNRLDSRYAYFLLRKV
jgi:SAM-dependent methyltransferase